MNCDFLNNYFHGNVSKLFICFLESVIINSEAHGLVVKIVVPCVVVFLLMVLFIAIIIYNCFRWRLKYMYKIKWSKRKSGLMYIIYFILKCSDLICIFFCHLNLSVLSYSKIPKFSILRFCFNTFDVLHMCWYIIYLYKIYLRSSYLLKLKISMLSIAKAY